MRLFKKWKDQPVQELRSEKKKFGVLGILFHILSGSGFLVSIFIEPATLIVLSTLILSLGLLCLFVVFGAETELRLREYVEDQRDKG